MALFGILIITYIAVFAWPVLWYRHLTRQWETQIKSQQNPEELQAWATNLLALYKDETSRGDFFGVTNRPPPGIPISKYGPCVYLSKRADRQEYVQLGWGGGFLNLWGMKIGDTNLVFPDEEIWKPGIYFFQSPGDETPPSIKGS